MIIMENEQQTPSDHQSAEFEIKKSRFIGAIYPCTSQKQALQQLNKLAKYHPNANHLAFAWRTRLPDGFISERCHDAGEPSGTAGRPILSPLQGQNIINVVVGVIRYFGGVKLGTGGLTRAYGNAAKLAINAVQLNPWVEMTEFEMEIRYSELQSLEYQLNKCNGQLIEQKFSDKVKVLVLLPLSEKKQLQQQFNHY
jgi:uncharacterized YigZ family protein